MGRTHRIDTNPRKIVGYIRISTKEQSLGPEAQRAALDRWCWEHGSELVLACTDHGVSGGAPLDKRPGLLAALAALKEHRAGVLLVAKRDRLARDTLVAAMVERLAERSGATVRTADGTADGDGPEAVLMRRIVDAFAEYERLLIRARTRAAMAVKRLRGERMSRVPAYGFRLSADGTHLEPDRSEQRVLVLVGEYRQQGLTLRESGTRLEAQGLLPRSRGRWHPQTLARVAAAALSA